MKVMYCIEIGCPYKRISGNGYSHKYGKSICMKLLIPISNVKKCPIDGLDIREVNNEYREKSWK
jgi:hypothetical protein